jgi:acyl-CoA synthetase (AMP-forming)/AMP-acid ligase II/thioesterase domain-containing protein
LRAAGVERDDRVALVVENGPEAASGFLAISSAAVCAPLNTAYREAECDFYLRDLRARALVVGSSLDTPARDVARRLGIDILDLRVEEGSPAGVFVLDGATATVEVFDPGPDAEALVLHTSGTTARPKIVPLAHRHLVTSASNVSATLGLVDGDRCLNVMPLFHIHGLVAGLLASLRAGGSLVCTPGFHQLRLFDWLRHFEPTWMTAVPTIYQALLQRAQSDPELVRGHRLRFVRSSSAALPVAVFEGIEQVLGVPIVEAYGMTEAAHQMASNPAPPGARKPGSVGLPAGPEITILDADGDTLPAEAVGEVAIRGANVFDGYEANPEANESSFVNGWFRTGDEGRIDIDGYLTLHGRLKEIINRAGEKVSPLEVDDVLLRHPSVAQAVTFGIPHERLGEEVAAAVVLRERDGVAERDLQDFVSQTVAPFKVPRRIVLVDEIPKGPTGKLQRIGLAERLDLSADDLLEAAPQSQELEESIAAVWAAVLEIPGVGPHDDFFALGGDSILGAEAMARVRELVGRPELPLVAIVRAPTPRALAAEVLGTLGLDGHGVLPLTHGGVGTPLFLAHAVDGDVVRYAALARALGDDRPVYGLRSPGHAPDEEPPTGIETIAAEYLDGIRAVQRSGPYLLGGFCMGAAVALEITHRLETLGERASLILVDPRIQRPQGLRFTMWLVGRRAREGRLAGAVVRRARRGRATPAPPPQSGPVWRALDLAREAYDCRPTTAPVALIQSEDYGRYELPDWYLRTIFPGVVATEKIPGRHVTLFRPPSIPELAAAVRRALALVERP